MENVTAGLMQVVQLPVIAEQLRSMRDKWETEAQEAEDLVCDEETLMEVKSRRSEMRREFDELEKRRKEVKAAVLRPYEQFESVYKECVTTSYRIADETYKRKIYAVESEMKQRCEGSLREYFSELCSVEHLEWLRYEQAGINADMASAKSKTPKKLQDQLRAFVVSVYESVHRIASMDNADEIMVEYKQTLDAPAAICTVLERHKRIEQERNAVVERTAAIEKEQEAVRRVEALTPPVKVQTEPVFKDKVYKCSFTVRATKPQLRKLKEFLNMEGIQYE